MLNYAEKLYLLLLPWYTILYWTAYTLTDPILLTLLLNQDFPYMYNIYVCVYNIGIGMSKAFGLQLRVSQVWREEAEAFLKSQGIEYWYRHEQGIRPAAACEPGVEGGGGGVP